MKIITKKNLSLFYLVGLSYTTLGFTNPCLAQFRPDRPTFFEDGQKYMEQEIRRLELQQKPINQTPTNIEHPSQLLTIDDGELKWQKYLFRDANFSVWMPQGTHMNESINVETKSGQIDFEVFATQPKSSRFIAAYSEDQNLTELGDEKQILSFIKQNILDRTNFKLQQEKNITFESNQGISLEMKNDQETIYFQIYVIDEKAYILGVSDETNSYQKEITSFFNSFRLLTE